MKQRMLRALPFATLTCCMAWLSLLSAPMAQAEDAEQGPMLMPNSHDYYPWSARRAAETGRVGLECSINDRGQAQEIVVLESGGKAFDNAAKRLFYDAHFRLPPGWSASGGPKKRFRYGVIFRLIGKPEVPYFDDHRRLVVITQNPG
jgi:TonB family protein